MPDGRRAVPAFQLIAERYLVADDYAPDAVAARCGIPAATIRRIAAELAACRLRAGRSSSTCRGRDWAGRAPRQDDRPPGLDACHARHLGPFQRLSDLPRHSLLQILLGTIDVPGGFRYKPPFPEARAARREARRQAGQVAPMTPLPGPPLGFVDRARGSAGRCRRHAAAHRQGLFLGGAVRRPWPDAHGHRAMRRAAIPIRSTCCSSTWPTWLELGDERRRTRIADLTAKRRRTATTGSRTSSIPTPIARRWSPMPISCCPTRPISSARTASRCSTGRSRRPTAPPMRSASRWSRPTATCGRSRTCCSISAPGSACPA